MLSTSRSMTATLAPCGESMTRSGFHSPASRISFSCCSRSERIESNITSGLYPSKRRQAEGSKTGAIRAAGAKDGVAQRGAHQPMRNKLRRAPRRRHQAPKAPRPHWGAGCRRFRRYRPLTPIENDLSALPRMPDRERFLELLIRIAVGDHRRDVEAGLHEHRHLVPRL